MFACVHVRVRTHMQFAGQVHACMPVYVSTRVRVCVHVGQQVRIHALTRAPLHMYTIVPVHKHAHARVHECVQVCTFLRLGARAPTRSHIPHIPTIPALPPLVSITLTQSANF